MHSDRTKNRAAITLINRMKQLFTERDLMQFDTKETVIGA